MGHSLCFVLVRRPSLDLGAPSGASDSSPCKALQNRRPEALSCVHLFYLAPPLGFTNPRRKECFLPGPNPVPNPLFQVTSGTSCACADLVPSRSILAFLSHLSFAVLPYYHSVEMYGYALAIGFSLRLTYTPLIARAPCFRRWREKKLWRPRM